VNGNVKMVRSEVKGLNVFWW